MIKLLLPLISSQILACAQVEIPDLDPFIRLPASKDCYSKTTVSRQSKRILAGPECEDMIDRSVHLSSDAWAKLRVTLIKNCLTNECKQTVGALDELFITIDNALKNIPKVIK